MDQANWSKVVEDDPGVHNDFDTEVLRARATYANSLLLPLDGLGDAAPLYDRGTATVDVDVFAEAAPL